MNKIVNSFKRLLPGQQNGLRRPAAEGERFAPLPNWVAQRRLPAGAKLLYALLLQLSYQKGFCYAGQRYLAAQLGVSVRTVQRWQQLLVRHKLVLVQRQRAGGKNQYLLRQRQQIQADQLAAELAEADAAPAVAAG